MKFAFNRLKLQRSIGKNTRSVLMKRRLLVSCMAVGLFAGFIDTPTASAQQSVNFFVGAFVPRGFDARGSQDVLFRNADFVGNLSECVGTLSDGSIVVSGQPLGLVPVPFSSPGPVRAEFLFNNGSSLRIEAASVSCSCYDRSEFVERFSA